MARKQLKVIFSGRPGAEQKYACKDCPARCCKNWGITISSVEAERIARDPEAVRRLNGRGPEILAQGQLPMREREGELACVFLDDDNLCSLHKRHGHSFLPAACQAFPFGFGRNEADTPVALLSRYCPSIAENYGEPVLESIESKLEIVEMGPSLSPRMGLRSGRALPKAQYLRLVDAWRSLLEQSDNLAQTLNQLFHLTEAADLALPRDRNPSDQEFSRILEGALQVSPPPLPTRSLSFGARVLIAHLLGAICYPLRVMQPFRDRPTSLREHASSFWVRLKWLFQFGRVRLLFLPAPLATKKVQSVRPFLASAQAKDLASFLSEVLARRQGMTKKTYLHRFIIELALMTVVASRYARALAASESQLTVTSTHVREGIGVAELLLSHQGQLGHSLVLDQLRLKLMSEPDELAALLGAEV